MTEPNHSQTHEAQPRPAKRGWHRTPLARWLGFFAGIGLLGWAIYRAIGQVDAQALQTQWDQFDWSLLPWLILVMPFSAIVIPAMLFWRTHRPFADPKRPVHNYEMQSLIAASGFLNYTPVKAGLIGRLAYLKHRHGIAYRASVVILALTSIAILSALAAVTVATLWRGKLDGLWWVTVGVVALVCALAGTAFVQRLLPAPREIHSADEQRIRHSFGWTYLHLIGWIGLGLCTIGVTAVRFDLAMRMMGRTLAKAELVLIAVLQIFCSVLPMNGLGMRELLIGWLFGADDPSLYTGIALVDRAAETIVVVILGVFSLWVLRTRMKFQMSSDPQQEATHG